MGSRFMLYFPIQKLTNQSYRSVDSDPVSHQHGSTSMNPLRSSSNHIMISNRRASLDRASSSSSGTLISIASRTVASSVARLGDLSPPISRSAHGEISANSSSTNGTAFTHRKFPMDPTGDCTILRLALVWADCPPYDDQFAHGPQMLNPTDQIWSPNTRFYLHADGLQFGIIRRKDRCGSVVQQNSTRR
ncbi:hypothetical protein Mapa_017382 [Marchantia paleacea]|nr:hypothetical protein Mapa_017382 [Marchantia paleacea]